MGTEEQLSQRSLVSESFSEDSICCRVDYRAITCTIVFSPATGRDNDYGALYDIVRAFQAVEFPDDSPQTS